MHDARLYLRMISVGAKSASVLGLLQASCIHVMIKTASRLQSSFFQNWKIDPSIFPGFRGNLLLFWICL